MSRNSSVSKYIAIDFPSWHCGNTSVCSAAANWKNIWCYRAGSWWWWWSVIRWSVCGISSTCWSFSTLDGAARVFPFWLYLCLINNEYENSRASSVCAVLISLIFCNNNTSWISFITEAEPPSNKSFYFSVIVQIGSCSISIGFHWIWCSF